MENTPPTEKEILKAEMKKASQIALLMGGIALVVGSLICLGFLLIQKPWKF